MRVFSNVAALSVFLAFSLAAFAADLTRDDVREVFTSLQGASAQAPPLAMQDEKGNLVNLGAPRRATFGIGGDAQPATKSATPIAPENLALQFMTDHATAFGMSSGRIHIAPFKATRSEKGANVKLEQYYGGLPVFGSRVNVNLDTYGGVKSVTSSLLRNTEVFDKGAVSLTPSATSLKARNAATTALKANYPGETLTASAADLAVYDPSMAGKQGKPRLVWRFQVKGGSPLVSEEVLADAHTAETLLHYSLVAQSKVRKIYDARNQYILPSNVPSRAEGDGPTTVTDVNQAYDYLGDTYDFYFQNFNRDSFDNFGALLGATVRYCDYYYGCPMQNAFFNPGNKVPSDRDNPNSPLKAEESITENRMFFGQGFAADDITAHELTHAVTSFTSDLIYEGESGALNEMMSDVFGESVDLVNAKGNDSASVRWLMGEDVPGGAIRSMADPPRYSDWMIDFYYSSYYYGYDYVEYPMPDRYLGEGWYDGWDDNGGVHHNSTVGSKAFFLMTDGQEFNRHFVTGMGLTKAAKIFYTTETEFLAPFSGYYDLGFSLIQSATEENSSLITDENVYNVYQACYATQILQPSYSYRSYAETLPACRVTPRSSSNAVVVNWTNPVEEGYEKTIVVRRQSGFVYSPYDPTAQVVYEGTGEWLSDNQAVAGTEYYYSAFAIFGGDRRGYSQRALNHVVAGTPTPDPISEPFSFFEPIDLSQRQITIAPIGDPRLAAASKFPTEYTNYSNYNASSTAYTSTDLPVSSDGATQINPGEDGFVMLPDLPVGVPFMGADYSSWIVAANGYLIPTTVFQRYGVSQDSEYNITPSYYYYHAIPRIAPMFANLSPNSAGQMWYKVTDDRLVVTWENVPEHGTQTANTFQVELFFSGHIRLTYTDANAQQAIVGISDGRGVPLSPTNSSTILTSDLSTLPAPSAVWLNPIAIQRSEEGQPIFFTASASAPVGTPTITMSSLPQGASYRQNSDGSATFTWTPGTSDAGRYSVFVSAQLGAEVASQYVALVVVNKNRLPVAENLTLFPEDPADDEPLVADFSTNDPDNVAYGDAAIYWFRNNAWAPALQDRRTVPASVTKVGETWYYAVVLRSGYSLAGTPVLSPARTIGPAKVGDLNKDHKVDVYDIQTTINGALRYSDLKRFAADVNGDDVTDAMDVQLVINSALRIH